VPPPADESQLLAATGIASTVTSKRPSSRMSILGMPRVLPVASSHHERKARHHIRPGCWRATGRLRICWLISSLAEASRVPIWIRLSHSSSVEA
jgi:hypothetical protein